MNGLILELPIPFSTGEITYRRYDGSSFNTGFWYLDLLDQK
jgi:hypothetical protein